MEVCTIITICLIFSNLRSVDASFVLGGWLFLVPVALLAQERTLPVPANVTIDGVPPIPDEARVGGRALRAVPARPADAWHPTERLDRWTFSEMAGGNAETLPEAEIVTVEELRRPRDLRRALPCRPRAFKGPRPVIINVHGGPVERERPRAIGRSNYFRNELGIAVIYPNIRGSSGFGRAFEELDNGPLRENAVKDIGALLDWIATQPGLDKNRVMIAGPSYGGYVALAAAIAYGDRLRGVNPAFGITDFPSYLRDRPRCRGRPIATPSTAIRRMPEDARIPDAHLTADQRRALEDAGLHRGRRQGYARADLAGRGTGEGAEGTGHAGVVRAVRGCRPPAADRSDQRFQHLHVGHVRGDDSS